MFGFPKGKKIDDIMEERRKQKEAAGVGSGSEDDEPVTLEKGDFLAMMIAAYITLAPAILVPIAIILAVAYFFS